MEIRKRRIAKNKRKVVFRLLLILVALLAMGLVVVGVMVLVKSGIGSIAALNEVAFKPGEQYYFTQGGFLYISDERLRYNDLSNNKKDYEVTMTGQDVRLAGSGAMHLLYNSSAIKIVDVEYPIEFTGSLISVKCGNEYFAVLRKDGSNLESIQVFDKSGVAQDQLEYEGQYIVDYGFYRANSEYLYVVSLSTLSSVPQSTISVYDMAAKTTSGVMHVQNQLIEQMHFAPQGIYVVGTNNIIRYSLSGKRETFREMIYGWQVFDYEPGANSIFLLRPRGSASISTIKLIQLKDSDTTSSVSRYLQMPSGTIGAYLMSGKIIGITADGYTLYSLDGKAQSSKEFPLKIDTAHKLNESNILLQGEGSYRLLKIA